jgi:hypothetical protein
MGPTFTSTTTECRRLRGFNVRRLPRSEVQISDLKSFASHPGMARLRPAGNPPWLAAGHGPSPRTPFLSENTGNRSFPWRAGNRIGVGRCWCALGGGELGGEDPSERSNTGQTLVKHWSNGKHRAKGRARRCVSQQLCGQNTGQTPVKHRSN